MAGSRPFAPNGLRCLHQQRAHERNRRRFKGAIAAKEALDDRLAAYIDDDVGRTGDKRAMRRNRRRHESSGGFDFGDSFDFVFELYTVDDFRQLVLTLQSPPGLDAAISSLNTVRRAVSCDSAPFMRMVRCLTVANTLSIGFEVRKWSQ